MVYINDQSIPDANLDTVVSMINSQAETILIMSFPISNHNEIQELLDSAQFIVNKTDSTISSYSPTICYSIADMDNRTFAKVRFLNMITGENPELYKGENTELLSLLGNAAELEYQNALIAINSI